MSLDGYTIEARNSQSSTIFWHQNAFATDLFLKPQDGGKASINISIPESGMVTLDTTNVVTEEFFDAIDDTDATPAETENVLVELTKDDVDVMAAPSAGEEQ